MLHGWRERPPRKVSLRVYSMRTGRERLLDGERGRELLVLDLDQLERLLGDFLARRGYGRDAFAPVAHLGVENVLVARHRRRARVRRPIVQYAGDVFTT